RSPRFGWFVGVQTLYRMSGLFATFFWLINSRTENPTNQLEPQSTAWLHGNLRKEAYDERTG
ncbi:MULTISPECIES: hypothetical protein, partial [unclassified Paenibacillus]|uniref:hypothetical protein n=1 Tax=unclassified Paenibacillus TaxID=185978 RepID=UPI002405DE19